MGYNLDSRWKLFFFKYYDDVFKLIVVDVVRVEVAVFAKLERRRVEEKLKQETIQAMKNNESNIKEKGLDDTFMNRIMLQAAKNKLLTSR